MKDFNLYNMTPIIYSDENGFIIRDITPEDWERGFYNLMNQLTQTE